MKKIMTPFAIETILFLRDFFGFFFTFCFPVMMLLLFGSIYGNEPSSFFGGLGSMDVSVPAYSAMVIGVTGLMAFPLTLSGYKERKIYKRFDATPVGKGRIIAAQVVVNLLMTIVGFLILLAAGKLIYQIQIHGNPVFIGISLLLSIGSIFSIGYFFTAITRDSKICNLLCYLSYFIMIFLSGATMPRELFPDNMLKISEFLPLTHVVKLLQGSFRGTPFYELKKELIILSLILFFFACTGAYFYKKKSWA